jgi:hypothetical protein
MAGSERWDGSSPSRRGQPRGGSRGSSVLARIRKACARTELIAAAAARAVTRLGVATVLKMKVFLLIGCCLPKIHIHSIC